MPRIRDISNTRKGVIDNDLSCAKKSEDSFHELQSEINFLRTDAATKYQEKIDETTKNLAKQREAEIEKLKNQIDSNIKKSQNEIKDFLAKSREKTADLIKNLTQEIKVKILTK